MKCSRATASSALVGLTLLGCTPPVRPAGATLEIPRTPTSDVQAANQAPVTESEAPHDEAEGIRAEGASTTTAVVPAGGVQVGRPGAVQLEAMSESGQWVVLCQRADASELDMPIGPRGEARDPFTLDLIVGEKAERIDALLAADRSGRYVVVLKSGQAWLIDTVNDERWNLQALSPSLLSDALVPHRSFAFASSHLVVVSDSESSPAFALPLPHLLDERRTDAASQLRSWAHSIDVGERPIYRAHAGEGYAAFTTLPEGSTEQDWPTPALDAPVHRCSTSSTIYSAFPRLSSYRPDPAQEVAWLALPDEPEAPDQVRSKSQSRWHAQTAPGFVMAERDSWVRRLDSGRLMLVRGGTQRQLASERCGARILHGYGPKDTFLIACEEYEPVSKTVRKAARGQPKYRFDLYLVRPGFVRSLQADVARTGVDIQGPHLDRWFPIRPGASAALVDFLEARLDELDSEARIIAVGAGGALVRRGAKLSLFIGAEHPEENVDRVVDALAPVLTRGSVATIGNQAFSLHGALTSWRLPAAPLAISQSGHVLIPNRPASSEHWPRGPLILLGPPSSASTEAPILDSAARH